MANKKVMGAVAAVAAATAIGASVVAAPAAQAASGDYSWVYGGYNVRACASTSGCPVLGMVAYSQWDRTWCYKDGGWAQGTNRWFDVTTYTGAGWKTGFVIAAGLPNSLQARVPACG